MTTNEPTTDVVRPPEPFDERLRHALLDGTPLDESDVEDVVGLVLAIVGDDVRAEQQIICSHGASGPYATAGTNVATCGDRGRVRERYVARGPWLDLPCKPPEQPTVSSRNDQP